MTTGTGSYFLKSFLRKKEDEGDYGVITIFSNLISRFWLFASDGSEQYIMTSLVTCPPAFMVPR
jgi:hypothetical protein